MMISKKISLRKKNEAGFTLAELVVGISVGIVVFSMAIAFLISFASSSYQANAKSEVTGTARVAITDILKQVSSAATIPDCAQWKSESLAKNVRDNPIIFKTTDNLKNNCIQLVNTGNVLRVAEDNAICWNKAVDSAGSTITFPDKISCIWRGDAAVTNAICSDIGPSRSDPDTLYVAECNMGSATPTSSGIVANLGPHNASPTSANNFPLRKPLFKYVNYDSTINPSGASMTKILKVSVNAEISYDNGRFKNGQKDYSVYKYSSTIQLAGMRAYLETGAYGS